VSTCVAPTPPTAVITNASAITATGARRAAVEPTDNADENAPPPVPNAVIWRSTPNRSNSSSISTFSPGIRIPKTRNAARIPTEETTPKS
jgi:hypothetical protein